MECSSAEMKLSEWLEKVRAGNPDVSVDELDEEERASVLTGFNNRPPVSEYKPERIIIAHKPSSQAAYMLFARGECLTLAQPMPWFFLVKWGVGYLRDLRA